MPYDKLLSNVAFNCSLRHCTKVAALISTTYMLMLMLAIPGATTLVG